MTDLSEARDRMLNSHLRARGITDKRVLTAMAEVPREAFVRRDQFAHAYDDCPLPSVEGQTISQPFIVALMIQALRPEPEAIALDVGAGTGYAAAVLSRLISRVVAVEYHAALADQARARCQQLGYDNIEFHVGDGRLGWPDQAPFDLVHVAACSPEVPPALTEQLADGGRLILPLGDPSTSQQLVRLTRSGETFSRETLGHVRFVPLLGTSH